MDYILLTAFDRGANAAGIFILAVLAAELISLPLMPILNYARNQRLKHIGEKVYGSLGAVTMGTGLVLIPASLFVVVAAAVMGSRGTGLPQSRSASRWGV